MKAGHSFDKVRHSYGGEDAELVFLGCNAVCTSALKMETAFL
jgi:hypothetical protein